MFSLAPIRTLSFIQLQVAFIALEKCEKQCNMLEIIVARGFCPLKIKITQSLDEFHLKVQELDTCLDTEINPD